MASGTVTNSTHSADVTWERFKATPGPEASKFRPMPGKLLILRDEPEEKTAGGLYKPQTAIQRPTKGTVIAVGYSDKHPGLDALKPGTRVYISYWAAVALELDGEQNYGLYLEKDIGGYVDDD